MAKFELYQDSRDEYRWRFKADNGRIIADSAEGYTRKSDCQHGIDLVKTEAPGAEVDDQTLSRVAAARWIGQYRSGEGSSGLLPTGS